MERNGVYTSSTVEKKVATANHPAVAAGFEAEQQLHVLAVDDSIIDRKVIERLLKISSCKVTTVDSGRRALQYLGLIDGDETSVGFQGLKVNLIITDYWMPGMTGYELMKKIKGSSTFKEVPVVIICLEEGAEEFIVKPVKLCDVKRLKNNITTRESEEAVLAIDDDQVKGILKREFQKTQDEDDLESSPSSSLTSSLELDSPLKRQRTVDESH
ncbi:hypothetical protein MKW94_000689 [Papaver nudicaule]|uniref:Response regulatory domain-containing protein n=1 Tax=Papaver nudicaule TaxID=74823 RepID=A0AA42AQJ3_PAPNU|nr:hypothetical protein [Papaver nudicaule]